VSTEFDPDAYKNAMAQQVSAGTGLVWGDNAGTATAVGQRLMNEQAKHAMQQIKLGGITSGTATGRMVREAIDGRGVGGSIYSDPKQTHFTVREIGNGFTVTQGGTELYAADMADVGAKVVSLLAGKLMSMKEIA